MGKSKIIYNGQTLIDLTGDTVTAETLLEGITAHGADGEVILGVMKAAAGGELNILSGTARPNTTQSGQLLLNCNLPEANFMLLHVERAATSSDTTSSKVSHVSYIEKDGEVLLKTTWGGKTNHTNSAEYLTIDRESGIISCPMTVGGNIRYTVTYLNVDYRWWYIYG